jgi:hypothetical protein
MALDFWRQSDIVSQGQLNQRPFTLIGAGGIGSFVALSLLKLGVTDLTVYDHDTVAAHNVPTQLYGPQYEGWPKVEALADILQVLTGATIKAVPDKFPLPSKPRGVIIAAVDSMAVRSDIWHQAVRMNPLVHLYVEARMGAEEGRVYTLKPHFPGHVQRYEPTLYTDAEALPETCTAHATGYNALFLAGLLVSQVKKSLMSPPDWSETIFNLPSNLLMEVKPSS